MVKERLIDPLGPFHGQCDRERVGEVGEVQTRPWPLSGLFDHPGADRIAEDIAKDSEEMIVLLNGKAFESTLPHMSVSAVVPMIAAHMTGHPPLHKGTQSSVDDGLQHQVKIIRHQTEPKDLDGMPGFRGAMRSRNAA